MQDARIADTLVHTRLTMRKYNTDDQQLSDGARACTTQPVDGVCQITTYTQVSGGISQTTHSTSQGREQQEAHTQLHPQAPHIPSP